MAIVYIFQGGSSETVKYLIQSVDEWKQLKKAPDMWGGGAPVLRVKQKWKDWVLVVKTGKDGRCEEDV